MYGGERSDRIASGQVCMCICIGESRLWRRRCQVKLDGYPLAGRPGLKGGVGISPPYHEGSPLFTIGGAGVQKSD